VYCSRYGGLNNEVTNEGKNKEVKEGRKNCKRKNLKNTVIVVKTKQTKLVVVSVTMKADSLCCGSIGTRAILA
jgi:hypothetical protein